MKGKVFFFEWFFPSLFRSFAAFVLFFGFCGGLLYSSDFYKDMSFNTLISTERIEYIIDSIAIVNTNKPEYAKREETYWRIKRQRGDGDAYVVLYLDKSNIVAYFSIIEEENGTKIIPAEVLRNPGKGRISWIGDFARGGVSFRKAHQMEKDFERVVFKNNDIPFVKKKPLSYSLAHLMMYPLSGMWWHSFLFIFIIVFFWMYFRRSKRWKQEK